MKQQYTLIGIILLLSTMACTIATVPPSSTHTPAPVMAINELASPTPPHAEPVETQAQTEQQTCTIQTGYPSGWLNLRTCPSVECAVTGIYPEGTRAAIIGLAELPWLYVEIDGQTGYLNSAFCGGH